MNDIVLVRLAEVLWRSAKQEGVTLSQAHRNACMSTDAWQRSRIPYWNGHVDI
jgi:predicted secreted hydrolase